jgi:GGDEF domain-containing protein
VPVSLFWIWPYSKALESELNDVKERHLVIAKNLAGAFERYYQDVTGVFVILDGDLKTENKYVKTLFTNYGYTSVMEVSRTGEVLNCFFHSTKICQVKLSPHILNLALKTLKKDKITLSTVTEDKSLNTGPMFLTVKEKNGNFILAYLSTNYVVSMGKKVVFGEKGHAAIVDQDGNVISHPLDSWIKSIKNISKVSAVQKMMEGKTGVEIFYSPALKSDMIAGYTVVKNAHWGVMVPQPISELQNKASQIDKTAMYVMIVGLLLALLITIPISFIIIKPLERLSKVIKAIEEGNFEKNVQLTIPKFLPIEIQKLKNGFIKMMNKIQENEKSISQLAYIDINTGLPNRNYFTELTNSSLIEMSKSNGKAALVFIDFDGFKIINDTYGHKAGDDLLSLFAERTMKYFSLLSKDGELFLSDDKNFMQEIPARLGGDEFVILFKNITDESEIKIKIESLFEVVFSNYKLEGNTKIKLQGSAGISIFPKNGSNYSELLKSADIAMYDAKAAGKNTIKFYTDKY